MVLDFDLDFLNDLAALLDAQLDRLNVEAKVSDDPDAYGVLDRAEYVVGLGFAVCQQYLTATCSSAHVKKTLAFDRGPIHRTGQPIAAIVNAAANYWKHSAEWSEPLSALAKRTTDLLRDVGGAAPGEYVTSNVLHELLAPLPERFRRLVPFLVQWRDSILDTGDAG